MNNEQRTDEWYLARKGKITASQCSELLPPQRGSGPFKQAAFSYLNTLVADIYTPDEEYIVDMYEKQRHTAASLQWGIDNEDAARERYETLTGHKVDDAPFIPLVGYEKFAGGSPDGFVNDKGHKVGIVEFKCPYNKAVHQDHYLYKDAADLKAGNIQYYMQCQMNMLCTDADWCDFVSYDPRTDVDYQICVLRLLRDDEMIDILLSQIDKGVAYIRERIRALQSMESIKGYKRALKKK